MTKTDHHLALVQRQRRFEWELARDAHTRAAAQFVTGKTHDLFNLVQIIELASYELSRQCGAGIPAVIAELTKAAEDAKRQLMALLAVARPKTAVVPGAPAGAAITAAVEAVREASAIPIDLHLTIQPEVTTRCSAAELEHVIYGLVLDVVATSAAEVPATGEPGAIELFVRERIIDGKPWLEIICGARVALEGEHFDLRAVETIAAKYGGELARSEGRGGGAELVVALPVVVAAQPAAS